MSRELPDDEQPLVEIMYASRATQDFSQQDLAELMKKARANNRHMGATGMLLYSERSFLQVLEGPANAVSKLYAEIGRDPRHDELQLLLRAEIEERVFEDWQMGCAVIPGSRLATLDGFCHFMRDGELQFAKSDGHKVRRLLHAFREGRYRQYMTP